MAAGMATGKCWFKVPSALKFVLKGKPAYKNLSFLQLQRTVYSFEKIITPKHLIELCVQSLQFRKDRHMLGEKDVETDNLKNQLLKIKQ